MLRSIVSALMVVGLTAVQALAVPDGVIDFEAGEGYTPVPWTVAENLTGPNSNWATRLGGIGGSTTEVTSGDAVSGSQKYELSAGAATMGVNSLHSGSNTGGFVSLDNEFWTSWWVKNSDPGADYAGRAGIYRGNTDGNFVGVAVSHPTVAGGGNFVLIASPGNGAATTDANIDDLGVSNSIASDWVQIALRVGGADTDGQIEVFINGTSLGLVSTITGGAFLAEAGSYNSPTLYMISGSRDFDLGGPNELLATSTTLFDRFLIGRTALDVELVPEPATLGLLGLGALLMLRRRTA